LLTHDNAGKAYAREIGGGKVKKDWRAAFFWGGEKKFSCWPGGADKGVARRKAQEGVVKNVKKKRAGGNGGPNQKHVRGLLKKIHRGLA